MMVPQRPAVPRPTPVQGNCETPADGPAGQFAGLPMNEGSLRKRSYLPAVAVVKPSTVIAAWAAFNPASAARTTSSAGCAEIGLTRPAIRAPVQTAEKKFMVDAADRTMAISTIARPARTTGRRSTLAGVARPGVASCLP